MDEVRVAELAAKSAGNWQEADNFVWFDQPDDAEKWAIFYTHQRDCDLARLSNGLTLVRLLAESLGTPDMRTERHDHWAAGWAEAIVVRVYDTSGSVTDAFRAWANASEPLYENPHMVLDEEDYRERLDEASAESVRWTGYGMTSADAPDDWPHLVLCWLSDNDYDSLEYDEEGIEGASPEAVRRALIALGMAEE